MMKKSLLCMLLAVALAACATKEHPHPLVGTWQCQVVDEEVRGDAEVRYYADGTSDGKMTMAMETEGRELKYYIENKGTWKLESGTLEETATNVLQVERKHSPETAAWIAESEAAQLVDHMMVKHLGALVEGKTERLTVKKLDKKTLELEAETFSAKCVRK